MMPSLLIVHAQSLERAKAADKAASLERCKLGGKLGGPTDMSAKHRALRDTQQKLKDADLNPETASKWQLGGATDIKPKTRKDLATRAKLEDAGLNPETASKSQLGGATDIKPTTRKDPATRAKFEDAGLDPDIDSKWQLGGKLGGGTDMSAKHRALPDTRLKLEDAGINHETASKWQLGGATDIKPTTREDPATRAKFEDAGLDPDTDSKQALGGKNGGGVPKRLRATSTSQTIHKASLRPKARKAAMMCISTAFVTKRAAPMPQTLEPERLHTVKGFKSNKTGIQSWRLIQRTFI
jgi:hypothetical protein